MNLEILKKNLYLIILPFLFVIFDCLVRFFVGMRIISPRAIAFSYLYGFLLIGLSVLFKSKRGKCIYLTVIILIGCLLAFTQSLYYNFFNDFYSFTRLSNYREFFTVKGETSKAFEFKYLLYFVISLISIIAIWKFKFIEESSIKFRVGKVFVLIAIFLIGFFSVKATFINDMEDKTQVYLTDDYLYDTLFSKASAMERFGVYAYSERDLYRIIENEFKKADPNELKLIDEYFSAHKREKISNDKSGIFKGKNVVLILAESLNSWGIHPEITPTLQMMKDTGIYMSNYFAPMFNSSTIDAEFMINTGLAPSLDSGNTAYVFSDNTFSLSLANLFKKQGYSAISFHNSIGSFYNRYQFHEALGFDKFYDAEELGINVPENFGYDWATDYDLFDKSSEVLLNKYMDKPFFSYLITVSTHTPYDDGRLALKENYEFVKPYLEGEDSQIIYYMAAAKDLDDGIKLMMERFEKQGILDDTVFILFGDHYSYGMHHDIIWTYDEESKGDFYNIKKVPLMIWTPNMKHEDITNICGQFEVYPTIANMFELDYNPTFNFGNDIFNFEDNNVVYGSRSIWRDKNLVYDTNQIGALYNDDPSLDTSYIVEKNNYLIERLNIFQKLLEQNYFVTDDFINANVE